MPFVVSEIVKEAATAVATTTVLATSPQVIEPTVQPVVIYEQPVVVYEQPIQYYEPVVIYEQPKSLLPFNLGNINITIR